VETAVSEAVIFELRVEIENYCRRIATGGDDDGDLDALFN